MLDSPAPQDAAALPHDLRAAHAAIGACLHAHFTFVEAVVGGTGAADCAAYLEKLRSCIGMARAALPPLGFLDMELTVTRGSAEPARVGPFAYNNAHQGVVEDAALAVQAVADSCGTDLADPAAPLTKASWHDVRLNMRRVVGPEGNQHYFAQLVQEKKHRQAVLKIEVLRAAHARQGRALMAGAMEDAGLSGEGDRRDGPQPMTIRPLTGLTPSKEDGALDGDRIWLNGAKCILTPDLRKLLSYLLDTNTDHSVECVRRHFAFSTDQHVQKRLTDLRGRLRRELKKAPRVLSVTTEEGVIYCQWVEKSPTTKELPAVVELVGDP